MNYIAAISLVVLSATLVLVFVAAVWSDPGQETCCFVLREIVCSE